MTKDEGLESSASNKPSLALSSSEEFFSRPLIVHNEETGHRARYLLDSTDTEVPDAFQEAWDTLLSERNGNIAVLDGYQFVMDTLMIEEGFRKLKNEDEACEKETQSIRRSYYSHLSHSSSNQSHYSCILLFSRVGKTGSQIMIQSVVTDEFKHSLPADHPGPPFVQLLASRYWVSNAYGGSLRANVVEMYRNLPELTIKLKEELVFKLKAIIAHGLTPPLLVGLDGLPLDVLERVFMRCEVKTAVNLARTCQRAKNAFELENVWRVLARREFPGYREISDEEVREKHGSWRQAFIAEWKLRRTQRNAFPFNGRSVYPDWNGPSHYLWMPPAPARGIPPVWPPELDDGPANDYYLI